jgi:lipoprotein NlpI
LTQFYRGDFVDALADFSRANEINPKFAYDALWVEIAERRLNAPSRLSQAALELDMTEWPAPLIQMFLGQRTPASAAALASEAVDKKRLERICEANFYSAEFALQKGDKNEAERLFRLSSTDCPADFIERDAAIAELKALGANR